MRTQPRITNLWTVIDILQRKLEREGYDRETCDHAITTKLSRLMHADRVSDIAPETLALGSA